MNNVRACRGGHRTGTMSSPVNWLNKVEGSCGGGADEKAAKTGTKTKRTVLIVFCWCFRLLL